MMTDRERKREREKRVRRRVNRSDRKSVSAQTDTYLTLFAPLRKPKGRTGISRRERRLARSPNGRRTWVGEKRSECAGAVPRESPARDIGNRREDECPLIPGAGKKRSSKKFAKKRIRVVSLTLIVRRRTSLREIMLIRRTYKSRFFPR